MRIDDIKALRRLAKPGPISLRWKRRVYVVSERIIGRAWLLKRQAMLDTPDVVAIPGNNQEYHLAAWEFALSGDPVRRSVSFICDGSAVITINDEDCQRYRRFVRGE